MIKTTDVQTELSYIIEYESERCIFPHKRDIVPPWEQLSEDQRIAVKTRIDCNRNDFKEGLT